MPDPYTPEEMAALKAAMPSWHNTQMFTPFRDVALGHPRSEITRDVGSGWQVQRRMDPERERPESPPDDFDPQQRGCSINGVDVTFNATSGVDFGVGTSRPIKMTFGEFKKALAQLAADRSFNPLAANSHTIAMDATPPCSGASRLTVPATTGSLPPRAGCFQSQQVGTASVSADGAFTDPGCVADGCPPECNIRQVSYGLSGMFDEIINFGNVAVTQADWSSVGDGDDVWITYSFGGTGEWQCTTGDCSQVSGDPCDCGSSGSSSSGDLCSNVLGVFDSGSEPAGTISTVDLVFSGTGGGGWTTISGVALLCFCDPSSTPNPPGCTLSCTFVY